MLNLHQISIVLQQMPHSSCEAVSMGSVHFFASFGLFEVVAADSALMADGLDFVDDGAILLFTQLGGACLLRILSLSDNEILILM